MTFQQGFKNDIDWEEITLRLQAFTHSLVSKRKWFRKSHIIKKDSKNEGEFKKESTYLKGKEVNDYVNEAIARYLKNPEKHDPQNGSLVDYLNLNIIRSLVINDLVSSENKTSKDLSYPVNLEDDEADSGAYLDRMLPFSETYFDEEIDFDTILGFIESEVKGDTIAEEIFFGVCINGLKRREVIKEFNRSENDFDNGMRRLKTILQKAAKKFDLKPQSL
jgi:hypothetical protein